MKERKGKRAYQKKKRPADAACVVFRSSDGKVRALPAVSTLLSNIRQWIAIEQMGASTTDECRARQSAQDNLRRVAEFAVNAGFDLALSKMSGKKGGKALKEKDPFRQGTTKHAAILTAAANYSGPDNAKVTTIARQTRSTPQYVRRVLSSEAGPTHRVSRLPD